MFYRQAQSAVMEALPRLKSLGIPTKRPSDYFAQMAKTDEHMQKVRELGFLRLSHIKPFSSFLALLYLLDHLIFLDSTEVS